MKQWDRLQGQRDHAVRECERLREQLRAGDQERDDLRSVLDVTRRQRDKAEAGLETAKLREQLRAVERENERLSEEILATVALRAEVLRLREAVLAQEFPCQTPCQCSACVNARLAALTGGKDTP